ncbi:MAG TPA: TIGR01212 family radical SAM protein, partial [Lachnospiraceae bacterium]|nr:TIGR01212 family radical SAM protein [Lachnospiraceae bacterium]
MWDSKPYHSLDYYFKDVYGEKIYKIAIDGGMTCPNRDGVLDYRGCIFC